MTSELTRWRLCSNHLVIFATIDIFKYVHGSILDFKQVFRFDIRNHRMFDSPSMRWEYLWETVQGKIRFLHSRSVCNFRTAVLQSTRPRLSSHLADRSVENGSESQSTLESQSNLAAVGHSGAASTVSQLASWGRRGAALPAKFLTCWASLIGGGGRDLDILGG